MKIFLVIFNMFSIIFDTSCPAGKSCHRAWDSGARQLTNRQPTNQKTSRATSQQTNKPTKQLTKNTPNNKSASPEVNQKLDARLPKNQSKI